ncbi:MAG: hypothetical protein IKP47_02435 [Ruminococcus sp.]|nr:hypothetical protein [Ruminococcus sp.]
MTRYDGLKQKKEFITSLLSEVLSQATDGQYSKEEAQTTITRELAEFAFIISAVDGVIDPNEAYTISEVFDLAVAPSDIGKYIESNNMLNVEFLKTVPTCVKNSVVIDNALAEQPNLPLLSVGICEVFAEIAGAVAAADNSIDQMEDASVKLFLVSINDYLNANLSDEAKKKA